MGVGGAASDSFIDLTIINRESGKTQVVGRYRSLKMSAKAGAEFAAWTPKKRKILQFFSPSCALQSMRASSRITYQQRDDRLEGRYRTYAPE